MWDDAATTAAEIEVLALSGGEEDGWLLWLLLEGFEVEDVVALEPVDRAFETVVVVVIEAVLELVET